MQDNRADRCEMIIGECASVPYDLRVYPLPIALWCVLMFVFIGKGTPAPFDPPRKLVIRGPYRFVRNPIYIGLTLAGVTRRHFVSAWRTSDELRRASNKGTLRAFRNADRFTTFKIFRRPGALR